MSLIKCKECGKEISDKAENCPHCGYPINKNAKNKTPFWLIIAAVIGAILAAIGLISGIMDLNHALNL